MGTLKMTLASETSRDVPLLPGGQLVLGHVLEFGHDPLALLQRAREYGDVVRVRFGPFHVYVLNSPEAIRQALVSQARRLEKGLNFGRVKLGARNMSGVRTALNHARARQATQEYLERLNQLGISMKVELPEPTMEIPMKVVQMFLERALQRLHKVM